MIQHMIPLIARCTAALLLAFTLPAFGKEPAKPATGTHVEVNGVRLYYEIHGQGKPLVLLHANGGNITTMSRQTEHFSQFHQIIAIDSRGHGQSEQGAEPLTYERMAADVVALLDKLKIPSTDILGWSDGGILGLLIAIQHPQRVGKLAVMGANLNPEGAYDWAQKWVAREDRKTDRMIANEDTTRDWGFYKQQLDLMGRQPNIPVADLKSITAPTLIIAGDKDIIRAEHSQLIFESIPKAQLCIMPGATHMAPISDHELFNVTVERFLKNDFVRAESKDFMR